MSLTPEPPRNSPSSPVTLESEPRRISIMPDPPRSSPSTPGQRRALGISALIAVATLVALSAPVSSGLFLGTLLAFSLLGSYDRLAQRWNRPTLVAATLATASGLAIMGGLFGIVYFVVIRAATAAQRLAAGFQPRGAYLKLMQHIESLSTSLPFGPLHLTERVQSFAEEAAAQLAQSLGVIAGATMGGALTLFFTVMTTFFVLRHWPEILSRAERMLPLHPKHTRAVLWEFQKVGKEVFIGTMLTGFAQGVLAGIGYSIAGVYDVALLATLTAICSLVPAVGTLLVWLPVGISLIIMDRAGAGVFTLLWGGLVVVGLSDYVIRPLLVGGQGHVPTLLTFISLFGGLEVFGLLGLIIGPVIAAVALALLRTYDREMCAP
ncbi:MAG TPA: AI-2E family transporter [Polyangiaceae bacterium]|nr:AI-2E family transporter [Polyangiaceae bacterium]